MYCVSCNHLLTEYGNGYFKIGICQKLTCKLFSVLQVGVTYQEAVLRKRALTARERLIKE